MSVTLLHKRNANAGTTPAPANLLVGELAINTADGRLYLKKQDGTIVLVNPPIPPVTAIVVDFGSAPMQSETFIASHPGAVVGQKVIASVSGESTFGADIDELELEPMVAFGKVSAANQITFVVATCEPTAFVMGQKVINYYVG